MPRALSRGGAGGPLYFAGGAPARAFAIPDPACETTAAALEIEAAEPAELFCLLLQYKSAKKHARFCFWKEGVPVKAAEQGGPCAQICPIVYALDRIGRKRKIPILSIEKPGDRLCGLPAFDFYTDNAASPICG